MITIDENIPGWCPPDMLMCFGWLMQRLPPHSTVVEIGVLWGRVTRTLALNRNENTKIICIDPCIETAPIHKLSSEQLARQHFNYQNLSYFDSYLSKYNSVSLEQIVKHSTGQSDIICFEKKSQDVHIDFNVDLAIIDGIHHGNGPLLDMEKFINQPNCLIIMDDWRQKWPAIINAVSIAKEKYQRSIWIPSRGNYVYILPKAGHMLPVMKEFISRTAIDNEYSMTNALLSK